MTCLRCKHDGAKRFGTYGRKRVQRYRCSSCNSTFSEPRQRPLGRRYTDPATAARIVNLLLEGMSFRAVARVTGIHKSVILSLRFTIGDNCRNIFNKRVRGIRPQFVQADDLWTFVHTQARHIRPGSPDEWGDAYIWMAMDSRFTRLSLGSSKTVEPSEGYREPLHGLLQLLPHSPDLARNACDGSGHYGPDLVRTRASRMRRLVTWLAIHIRPPPPINTESDHY